MTAPFPVAEEIALDAISENERMLLQQFFQILIRKDGLGYVLFGRKPICLSGYFTCLPLGNMLDGFHSSCGVKIGWDIWKKYEKQFPHPQYLIFEEIKKLEDVEVHSIYFVHKGKLLENLKIHQNLFIQELDNDFKPDEFLEKIEKNKSYLNY